MWAGELESAAKRDRMMRRAVPLQLYERGEVFSQKLSCFKVSTFSKELQHNLFVVNHGKRAKERHKG